MTAFTKMGVRSGVVPLIGDSGAALMRFARADSGW
jgi:hypothetical protein